MYSDYFYYDLPAGQVIYYDSSGKVTRFFFISIKYSLFKKNKKKDSAKAFVRDMPAEQQFLYCTLPVTEKIH